MGKGDKKSRRGKIILGSSGVRRPKSSKNKVVIKTETVPAVANEKTKKLAEKPKTELKPKVKVAEAEPVAVTETEITDAPKKTVKKAVKKAKEDVAE